MFSRRVSLPIVLMAVCAGFQPLWSADRGEIHSGETGTGSLAAPGFSDSWHFSGNLGDRVVITAGEISGFVEAEIYLYPPGGGALEASAVGSSSYHRLDHQLLQTGLYTVIISDWLLDEEGDYGVALVKIPGAATSPTDPDGGPIASGQTMRGTLSYNADTDVCQFYGDAGDRVVITAGEISGFVEAEIYLYPPGGGALEASAVGSSSYHRLDHQLLQTGLYTVIISDWLLDEEGDYGVALVKIPGAATSLTDPDGGPIASGQTMRGTLSYNADTDVCQFYGDAGDRVVITAGEISGWVEPEIYLYPPGGGALEASAVGSSSYHRLDHQLLQTGLYTVIISDWLLDEEGDYGVALVKIPGAATSPTDPDGATPVISGFDSTGTLSWNADTDLYQFYGSAGDRVVITAGEISGYVEPEIYLHPPGGGDLETSAVGSSSYHQLDHQLLRSGLYTVIISDWLLDEEGEYGISFSKIPSAIRPGVYNPSPPNGAAVASLRGSFRWDAVAGASGYDVYFGENVTKPLGKVGSVASPSLPFPAMEAGKIYYWQVVAKTAGGDIKGPIWWISTAKVKTGVSFPWWLLK